LRKTSTLSKPHRQSLEDDVERIKHYLEHEFRREGIKTVAIFSCTGKKHWETLRLPIGIPSRIVIDTHYYIQPLVRLMNEYERYCVVLVNKELARIFTLHLGTLEEHSTIVDEVPAKVAAPSRYEALERRMERHHLARVHDHLKRVNTTLLNLFKEKNFDHLIIGGKGEIPIELERTLHSYVAQRIVGKIESDIHASSSEILLKATAIEQEIDRQKTRRAVERLTQDIQTGKGIIGLRETLRALSEGRVYRLFVVDGFSAAGAQCKTCGTLSINGGVCACGAKTVAVQDIVEKAIDEAIDQSTEVTFVNGDGIVKDMGAILRY
jgi:peptide chain release factor subunit 1